MYRHSSFSLFYLLVCFLYLSLSNSYANADLQKRGKPGTSSSATADSPSRHAAHIFKEPAARALFDTTPSSSFSGGHEAEESLERGVYYSPFQHACDPEWYHVQGLRSDSPWSNMGPSSMYMTDDYDGRSTDTRTSSHGHVFDDYAWNKASDHSGGQMNSPFSTTFVNHEKQPNEYQAPSPPWWPPAPVDHTHLQHGSPWHPTPSPYDTPRRDKQHLPSHGAQQRSHSPWPPASPSFTQLGLHLHQYGTSPFDAAMHSSVPFSPMEVDLESLRSQVWSKSPDKNELMPREEGRGVDSAEDEAAHGRYFNDFTSQHKSTPQAPNAANEQRRSRQNRRRPKWGREDELDSDDEVKQSFRALTPFSLQNVPDTKMGNLFREYERRYWDTLQREGIVPDYFFNPPREEVTREERAEFRKYVQTFNKAVWRKTFGTPTNQYRRKRFGPAYDSFNRTPEQMKAAKIFSIKNNLNRKMHRILSGDANSEWTDVNTERLQELASLMDLKPTDRTLELYMKVLKKTGMAPCIALPFFRSSP